MGSRLRSRGFRAARLALLVAAAMPASASAALRVSAHHSVRLLPARPYTPSTTAAIVTSPVVMLLVVVGIAVLVLFVLGNVLLSRVDPLVARVGGFVSLSPRAGESGPRSALRRISDAPTTRRLLARFATESEEPRWKARMAAALELAEIEATPEQVLAAVAITTLVAGYVLAQLLGVLGFLVSLVAVPLIARQLVIRRHRRRRRLFAEQLPDNLDVLASALRAGHTLVSALAVVTEDAAEPSKTEYARVLSEEQLGANFEDALNLCAERMQNSDLEQVALVARLQREIGSNSAEVLDQVVVTLRERMELRRLAHTLTAQGRFSRWILTAVPIGLLLLMTLLDPSYMQPLFHRGLGKALLLVVSIMVTVGSLVIGRIVEIEA